MVNLIASDRYFVPRPSGTNFSIAGTATTIGGNASPLLVNVVLDVPIINSTQTNYIFQA